MEGWCSIPLPYATRDTPLRFPPGGFHIFALGVCSSPPASCSFCSLFTRAGMLHFDNSLCLLEWLQCPGKDFQLGSRMRSDRINSTPNVWHLIHTSGINNSTQLFALAAAFPCRSSFLFFNWTCRREQNVAHRLVLALIWDAQKKSPVRQTDQWSLLRSRLTFIS